MQKLASEKQMQFIQELLTKAADRAAATLDHDIRTYANNAYEQFTLDYVYIPLQIAKILLADWQNATVSSELASKLIDVLKSKLSNYRSRFPVCNDVAEMLVEVKSPELEKFLAFCESHEFDRGFDMVSAYVDAADTSAVKTDTMVDSIVVKAISDTEQFLTTEEVAFILGVTDGEWAEMPDGTLD